MDAIHRQICKGKWIYREMKHYVNSQKARLFFPHLVTALCQNVEVPMGENEKIMKPNKSIIGYSLYNRVEEKEPTLEDEDEIEE
ncbi:hypothetical protein PVK06_008241 [Gossypium arboreum]|uniref:Uncharacterized protein n=1 Tax=Gossypium arboreum TaxID=29729 RepID=A0ABR0QKB2_GOSAR|nr:hypothetical protein PVK06_008241 [Gossypium arboreum]